MRRTGEDGGFLTPLRKLHREIRVMLTPVVEPEKWVFVVGCYNSGTELLASMLGAHEDISALPDEGQFLTTELVADYVYDLPRMWVLREDLFRLDENDPGPDARRIQREWIMRLDRSRPIFLEKSPPNAARTRWLQANFPRAHFVFIVRNGYAVAEGIRRKAEPRQHGGRWPIHLCARQWARSHEVLLDDARHLERVIQISYEELAEDPSTTLGRILRFLDREPEPAGIDPDRSWRIHERREPVRNMNPASLERLSAEDRAIITEEAGEMLDHFGYPRLD